MRVDGPEADLLMILIGVNVVYLWIGMIGLPQYVVFPEGVYPKENIINTNSC